MAQQTSRKGPRSANDGRLAHLPQLRELAGLELRKVEFLRALDEIESRQSELEREIESLGIEIP